jgi:steroid delta-isomerase-like uncharacterized protein
MRHLLMILAAALVLANSPPVSAGLTPNQKTASRVLLEKMGGGDFSKLDEIYGPGFAVHSGDKTYDLEHDNASAKALRTAVPDMKVLVRRIAGDGNLVAVHWSASGTNSVAAAGLPGKGKTGGIEGMTFFRFDKGLIVEEWSVTDLLSMMRDLEMLP